MHLENVLDEQACPIFNEFEHERSFLVASSHLLDVRAKITIR